MRPVGVSPVNIRGLDTEFPRFENLQNQQAAHYTERPNRCREIHQAAVAAHEIGPAEPMPDQRL